MARFVSSLSPVPTFPEYTGPYKVGTVDVEIPVSKLSSPSPAPEAAAHIDTVLFRIFYPATADSYGKRIPWLPAPQRLHIASYAQFLGAGPTLASILSFLPRHLHWTTIPAHKNAALLSPPGDRPRARWPTMLFSHGLGGNRNAYSHLAGSLASHGVVVICPEHRDGSAALSVIRDPNSQDRKGTHHIAPYIRIPHDQTHEVWEARNEQLRIRLWELSLVFEAVSALDLGDEPILRSNLNNSTPQSALSQFAHALDIHEPGRVIFSGHSFGAATVVQLLKSTFYAAHPSLKAMSVPLFTPHEDSALTHQITPSTPTMLLDMWCFPLLSASTAPLYDLPLPCYASTSSSHAPTTRTTTSPLLAIESQAFFDWTTHLHAKARILSPSPSPSPSPSSSPTARTITRAMFAKPGTAKPHFFYVTSSAHLSQSDFGVLFPWLTRRVFRAEGPAARVLRLNLRAQLQFLRENGFVVAGTARRDLVDGFVDSFGGSGEADEKWVMDDSVILEEGSGEGGKGKVDAWRWIDVVGLGAEAGPSELEMARGERESGEEERAEAREKEMQTEIEPGLDTAV